MKKKFEPNASLWKIEKKQIRKLRKTIQKIESPNQALMYTGAGELITHHSGRSLLPKAMELLYSKDSTLQKLAFRMVGLNAFGQYVEELFVAMKHLNPAEREQVLQSIEEGFSQNGTPESNSERKQWVEALANLGREHQPTVFGLMAYLGRTGKRWVWKRIKNHVETLSLGTVPQLLAFPKKTRNRLIKLLCKQSAEKKRELLPYIGGIVDQKTVKYLTHFLRGGSWQERVEVANAVAKAGVKSSAGIVMDIVADEDWRVKQELLENINIERSRFTSLLKIIDLFLTYKHTRVRNLSERVLLQLGTRVCLKSNLEKQRKKLEKSYREQLLHAAPRNKDVDSEWLGVNLEELDPIPFLPEDSEESAGPVGLSLSDIAPKEEEVSEEKTEKKDLLFALLSAKSKATTVTSGGQPEAEMEVDQTLSSTERFVMLLKKKEQELGREVPLEKLQNSISDVGLTIEEFFIALAELEKDGIIYRSSEGTVSYVEMDL